MTLDEAIKHAEKVAEEKENEAQDLEYSKLDWRHEANQCSKCAEEHRQLAEWLKDYKRLLEQEPVLDKIRAEIDRQQKWLLHAGYTVYNVDIALDAIKSVVAEGSDKE